MSKIQRICLFCGASFNIKSYFPYYSCPKCRKKENLERDFELKKCHNCNEVYAGSKHSRLCRSCATKLLHNNIVHTCTRCGKLTVNDGSPMCILCRRDLNRSTNICLYCGDTTTNNIKVCSKCRIYSGMQICINCKKIFKSNNSSKFCSKHCSNEFSNKLSLKPSTNIKTTSLLKDAITLYLIKNPSARIPEILSEVNVSQTTLVRHGIVISDIQRKLKIPCSRRQTLFEQELEKILNHLNIEFYREKTFSDLKDKRHLRFDFYIPKYNLLIEADGDLHYKKENVLFFNTDIIRLHDKLKNDYALRNKFSLLRVKYFRFYNKEKTKKFIKLMQKIKCTYQETGKLNLFNCWNGSELIPIPISNQDSKE